MPTSRDSLVGWFLRDGYLYDWLVAAGGIVINLAVPEAIQTANRYFTPGDPSLSYPYKSNTISSTVLYILVFIWPGCMFLLIAGLRRSFADGHHALLSLAEGFALTTGWKRWINLVGRYRPNWFALVARGDSSDGRLAYPSGHSAYMFYSGTILTLYLAGKLRILACPSQALFAKFALCLAPVILATFVACTRLTDYKHDFSDVNAGCFIGLMCGAVSYFLNYPSLFSLDCAQPKLRTRDSALHTGTTLASAQRHNIEGTWQSKHVKDSDTHDTHNAHTGNGPTGSDGRPLIV